MLKHDKSDFASLKVLLIADVFVRRNQDFETRLLGYVEQFAVCEFLPPPHPRFLHRMTFEEPGKASRRAVIEKNQHPSDDLAKGGRFFERTRYKCHQAL